MRAARSRSFPPVTATIDRPAETEVLVEGLPVGAVCAVIETDDGGADTETPRLVGVVITVRWRRVCRSRPSMPTTRSAPAS